MARRASRSPTCLTSHTRNGHAMPLSGGVPRSVNSNRGSRNRRTSSLTTTVCGAATLSSRAAMFGVLPKADVSERSALPISPTIAGTGMDADARLQPLPTGRRRRVHGVESLEDRETREDGALGVVLVRGRIAEICEQTVAEVLRNVAAEPHHDGAPHLLIREDELAELLGIQLLGERSRTDEVAEEDRQSAPLTGAKGRRRRLARRAGRSAVRAEARRCVESLAATATERRGCPVDGAGSARHVTPLTSGRPVTLFLRPGRAPSQAGLPSRPVTVLRLPPDHRYKPGRRHTGAYDALIANNSGILITISSRSRKRSPPNVSIPPRRQRRQSPRRP